MSPIAYPPPFCSTYTSVVLSPKQIPVPNPDPLRHLQPALETKRQLQATHDAQVVREIVAGCRERRERRKSWGVTPWLFLLAQAFAALLCR